MLPNSICLPHRTLRGGLEHAWEYVPNAHKVLIALQTGSMHTVFSVDVCSANAPRLGAHPIARIDLETWRIIPMRYVRSWVGGVEQLTPFPCPISSSLTPGDALMLLNAPIEVTEQLEEL